MRAEATRTAPVTCSVAAPRHDTQPREPACQTSCPSRVREEWYPVPGWQGRLEEAEPWVQRAERTVRADAEPAAALAVHYLWGLLELTRGRDADALTAFRAAERLTGHLAASHYLVIVTRAMLIHALVRLGDTERAEQALAGLEKQDSDRAEIRIAAAMLRLAQDDPQAATTALAPVLDGSAALGRQRSRSWPWRSPSCSARLSSWPFPGAAPALERESSSAADAACARQGAAPMGGRRRQRVSGPGGGCATWIVPASGSRVTPSRVT